MIQIWIIAGEARAGKSTTIRCLTGIRVQSSVCIKKADGHYFHVYSFMRSVQEVQLGSPAGFQNPSQFCDLLEQDFFVGAPSVSPNLRMSHRNSVANYLIPLRVNPHNGLPGYLDYVWEMLQRKFVVKSIILFEDHWTTDLDHSGIDIAIIHDFDRYSGNERADQVRKYWGWV